MTPYNRHNTYKMPRYFSTKTYDHNEGLSCAFRQWRANSHCNLIHGYALSVKLTFVAFDLDDQNWVQDFGGLKDVKAWLKETFDHTYCVAKDDPEIETFYDLSRKGLIDLRIVESTGCEAFAKMIYDYVENKLNTSISNTNHRVALYSVEVREHSGNSGIYEGYV